MTTSKQLDQEPEQKDAVTTEQAHSAARRRLIQGVSATPVLMVSGRSALACDPQTEKCGLSPMAWMSVHPKKQSSTAKLSHSVGCSGLGKSPGYWTPKTGAQTFGKEIPWPVKPFEQLKYRAWTTITDKWGRKTKVCSTTYTIVPWVQGKQYSNLPFIGCDGVNAGWNSGAKCPVEFGKYGSNGRSISQVLIDETASQGILWHLCCAYLNSLALNGAYALTTEEVLQLADGKLMVRGTTPISISEVKSFLDQTWV